MNKTLCIVSVLLSFLSFSTLAATPSAHPKGFRPASSAESPVAPAIPTSTAVTVASAGEPWKGHTETSSIELGAITGFANYGSASSWSVLGTGAYLLLPQGWADSIDNRVWLEAELGPSFFHNVPSSQTGLQYSTHLRWDFNYNHEWTFYGLGGLGGFVLPSALGSTFVVRPRFGVGSEFQTKATIRFRAEITADLLALGVAFDI